MRCASLSLYYYSTGVYIKFEYHIFVPPPPSWFIFLSQITVIIMRGCASQAIFFLQFCIIWVNLGNLADFLPIEEKICIFPFFHHLSIIFFPNMLFGHILVKQKNIHPCYNTNAQTEMPSRHKDLYIWLDQKQRTYFRGSRARRGTSIISWSRGPYPSTLRSSPLKLGRRESNGPRTHPSMGHGLGIDGRGDLAVPVPPTSCQKS